jgi:hypothetical protein
MRQEHFEGWVRDLPRPLALAEMFAFIQYLVLGTPMLMRPWEATPQGHDITYQVWIVGTCIHAQLVRKRRSTPEQPLDDVCLSLYLASLGLDVSLIFAG